MDINPLKNDKDPVSGNNPTRRSVQPSSQPPNSEVECFRIMKADDKVPESYRVDETARRMTIFQIDQDTGEVIRRLSPLEAVAYVKHLNEAIKNMINEVA